MKLPDKFTLIDFANLLVILASLALQWYATSCGPGFTSDSWQYLHASQSLAEQGTLIYQNDLMAAHWPPLFPWLLSLTHPHQVIVTTYLNRVFLAVTLLILYFLIKQTVSDPRLQTACLLAIGLGLPTIMPHVFLWSEPLFLCLFTVLLLLLFRATKSLTLWYWLALALVSAALCLQRYSGIFLVIGIALGLWVLNPNPKHGAKTLIYLACSLAPLGLYVLVIQSPASAEVEFWPRITFFGKNLISHYFLDTALAWYLPHQLITNLSKWLFIGLGTAIFVTFSWKFRLLSRLPPFHKIVAAIIGVYFILLNSLQLPISEQSIKYSLLMDVERYMCIIYPASMLLLFYGFDRIAKRFVRKSMLYFLLALWLCYPIARTVKNVSLWHKSNCTNTF